MLEKNDKIYRYVSRGMLAVHILVFLLVMVGSFLPYVEEKSFFQLHIASSDDWLSWLIGVLFYLAPLGACVLSWLAIRRPGLAFLPGVCMAVFFCLYVLISLGVAVWLVFGFAPSAPRPTLFPTVSHIFESVYYVMFADGAFGIYAFFTRALRRKEARKKADTNVDEE